MAGGAQHDRSRKVSRTWVIIMKNVTLRERFGIDSRNSAQVSQLIRAALDRALIRPADRERPKSGYVPAWA